AIAGPQPRHRVAPVICHPDGSVDAVIDQARWPVTHGVGPEEGSIERPQLRQGITAVVRHPDADRTRGRGRNGDSNRPIAYLGNFPVGNRPVAVAVSTSPPGSVSIWVANNRSNALTKLRAFDGALLGTYPVGDGPSGLVYDCVNASIWVTNDRSNTVTRLRASDGANLGTFPVGKRPVGIAFDGTSIWVANQFSDSVTQLRALDGANLGTIPVGRKPFAVAFAGAYLCVAISVS